MSLQFKFSEKLKAHYASFGRALATIDGLPPGDRQARANSTTLVDPHIVADALIASGVPIPANPEDTWRRRWNELDRFGLLVWNFQGGNPILELSDAGRALAGNPSDYEKILLKTLCRYQLPNPLKDLDVNFRSFLRAGARIVPYRRAIRTMVELEKIALSEAYLTDVEWFFVLTSPDWIGVPDGDPTLAAQVIHRKRTGQVISTIHERILANVAQSGNWNRLFNALGAFPSWFIRTGNKTSLMPGASGNQHLNEYALMTSSYIDFSALDKVPNTSIPPTLYTAWGLYQGHWTGNEKYQTVLEEIIRSCNVET